MSYTDALDLLEGSSWNEASEIWDDELGSTVTISGGVTTINYTRLLSLPTYYGGELENDPDVFVSIADTDYLWGKIQSIMGQGTKNGFEAFFDDVAKINFSEQTQSGDNVGAITFGGFDRQIISDPVRAASLGYVHSLPWEGTSNEELHGDLFFDFNDTSSSLGSSAQVDANFMVILHEVAHALGLEHPEGLDPSENTAKYTVMIDNGSSTYRHDDMYYATGELAIKYSSGLGLYDIVALQEIYGRDYSTRSTNTVYDSTHGLSGTAASTAFTYTIWDGGGTDTINASAYSDAVQIDLRQGHFSSIGKNGNPNGAAVAFDSSGYDSGNVAIAYHTIIENATGTDYDDDLIGNDWINILKGGEGNDRIYGDGFEYDADHGYSDVVGDSPNSSKPTNDDDELYGEDGEDFLYGGAGNDKLYGGADEDIIYGGGGNDTFYFKVSENSSLVSDELHFGQSGSDTLRIELVSAEITNNIRDEILSVYKNYVLPAPSGGFDYNFTHLHLTVEDIENLIVTIDGSVFDLTTKAKSDAFFLGQGAGALGNLFFNNGYGTDYTFGSVLVASAGTFTTSGGNTLVIQTDGSFSYTPGSTYTGRDTFSYSVTDTAGTISTAIAYFNVQETLDHSSATPPSSGYYVIRAADPSHPLSIFGTSGNDDILGGYYSDYINGGAGNDRIVDGGRAGSVTVNDHFNNDNDTFIGGEGNDIIQVNHGHDVAYGGAGNDTIVSFYGMPTLYGDDGNDTINLGQGTGSLSSGNLPYFGPASVYGGTGLDIINVYYPNSNYIDSGSDDDTVNVFVGTNTILLGEGNDQLLVSSYGSFIAWIDLDAGAGNDTVYITNGAGGYNGNDGIDTISLATGFSSGINIDLNQVTTVYQSVNKPITISNFENITTTSYADTVLGTSGANTINTGSGDDIIDGGTGNDTMIGGAGNDTYYVDSVSDIITENSSSGIDQVYSSVTFTLSANVEKLILLDALNINGTGNALGNTITGNIGDNILDGGTGADNLVGSAGNDVYKVDNAGDTVNEILNEGIDIVESTVTHILSANVENLTLTGMAVINGTGNGLDNILTGNSNTNILTGGDGNDTYIVQNTTDSVIESANQGNDTVEASATFTLSNNVENLTLTGASTINGTGNGLDNIVHGNLGNNILNGGNGNDTLYGGLGTDTLIGGTGSDVFIFEVTSAFSQIDTISDYNPGQGDVINIADLLTGYTSGLSDINDFCSVVTSGSNTQLFVDRDGAGSTYSSSQIATLTGVTGLDVDTLLANNNLIAV